MTVRHFKSARSEQARAEDDSTACAIVPAALKLNTLSGVILGRKKTGPVQSVGRYVPASWVIPLKPSEEAKVR